MLLFLLPACYDPGLKWPDTCEENPQGEMCGTEPPLKPNSYTCQCSCGIDANDNGDLDPAEEATVGMHELEVCMHADDNPNFGPDPTDADLTSDCQGRVRRNLQKIGRDCIAALYLCEGCRKGALTTPVMACERDFDASIPGPQPCEEVPLMVNPETMECDNFTALDPQNPQANFKEATNHPTEEPVCLADRADPPVPTASALAAGIFGRVTRCDVAGTAELNIDGPKTPDANGVVSFTGEPCTGPSCDIGMFFKLHVQDFEVKAGGSLFGVDFDVVKGSFKEMQGWGASVPGGATLTPSGAGRFAGRFESGELLSTGRGVVDKCVFDDVISDSCIFDLGSNRDTILARNDGPLEVTVAWAGDRTCSLDGTVSTLGDGFGVHLTGDIVNQPPQANAGADHTAECTSSAGGTASLNGSASSDPDTDPDAGIKLFSWRRGGRAGEQVALESMADVALGVGETQNYVLTVVDGFGQASHDSVVVGVADTTAPSIQCNAQPSITPNSVPIAFTATATDSCDPTADAVISAFDCFAFTRGGKRVDKRSSCVVALNGATITILDGGGVDTHIRWIVRGSDDSGNTEHKACEVLVVKP